MILTEAILKLKTALIQTNDAFHESTSTFITIHPVLQDDHQERAAVFYSLLSLLQLRPNAILFAALKYRTLCSIPVNNYQLTPLFYN